MNLTLKRTPGIYVVGFMGAGEQADRAAVEMRPMEEHFCRRKRLDDIGISRHQGLCFDAVRSQSDRERADDVGKAAGLDDRIDFRGDRKNAKRRHASSLSIIGCVMREIPCGVVLNRFASSSVSSPTTRPSGI